MSAKKKVLAVKPWLGASVLALGLALAAPTAHAAAPAATDADDPPQDTVVGVADILVVGQRSLNNDIRRDRDDIQPYVVFDSALIEQSGAQNVEDFLQSRLPMNATLLTQSQVGPPTAATGRLDLRGLGPDETLVLVDGRRLPSIATGDSFGQPNINGISMSQIERIEVLPSTASGIYGGGATGGVINIVLKRKYSGLDLEARYGDSTDLKAGQSFFSINGGLTFDEGRTRVMGSFSRSRAETLNSGDRDFFRRGAQLQFRNDPANQSILLGGPNICPTTVDGFDCLSDPLVLLSGAALNSSVTSIPDNFSGNPADLAARSGKLIFDRSNVPLWTAPNVTTYNFNIRREFGSKVEIFADFSRDESKSTNITSILWPLHIPEGAPSNPFQQDVLRLIDIPDELTQTQNAKNTRANVGAIVRLPHQWSAALQYDWLRSKSRSVSNSVLGPSFAGEATLQAAAFSDLSANPLADPLSLFDVFSLSDSNGTTLEIASLRLGGPIVKLPGGDLTATALVEKRWESSDDTVNTRSRFGVDSFFWSPKAVRNVESGYLELRAPIVGASNDVPLIHQLELMGSVRRDRYTTRYSGYAIPIDSATGPFPDLETSTNKLSSTNYTFGLKYAPTQDIAFRASWGNGFLPPKLGDIRSEPPALFSDFLIFLLNLRDPARGDALIPGPLTILGAGNPDLKPEKSKSFSAGVVLTPRFVPGLRISVDLTSIRKSDEVLNLPVPFFLANEALFPGRITRGPNLPGDAPGTPGPITAVDTTTLNLAKSKLRAIDIQVDYDLKDTSIGNLHFYGVATRTNELSLQTFPGEPSVDRAGFYEGPLKWRGNVGVDWKSGSWSAGWNTQIYGSYRVCESFLTDFTCNQAETWQGARKIRSQNYSDIYVSYEFKEGGILEGTNIRLGIQNVFDQKPPTVASGRDQLGYSSFGDPRLQRFTLALRKHF